jgi:hypothetical protein
MTGTEIVRHRDMYQKLFTTMIGYLNMGLGRAVQRNRSGMDRVRRPCRVHVWRAEEHDDRLRA